MKIPGQRNRVCCFVDDLNLPDNCDLSLMPVEIIARSVVPMMQTQYRLRLAEGYEPLVSTAMFKFLIASQVRAERKYAHRTKENDPSR